MMLRYSFGMEKEASAIENAVEKTLDQGWRTADMMSEGMQQAGARKITDIILANLTI